MPTPLEPPHFTSQGEYWRDGRGNLVPIDRMEPALARTMVAELERWAALIWPRIQAIDGLTGQMAQDLAAVAPESSDEVAAIAASRMSSRFDGPEEWLEDSALYRALKRRGEKDEQDEQASSGGTTGAGLES